MRHQGLCAPGLCSSVTFLTVVSTRTGLPVSHRAPRHHLKPGSAPRTGIAFPNHQFRTSAPDNFFYDKFEENFARFFCTTYFNPNVLV